MAWLIPVIIILLFFYSSSIKKEVESKEKNLQKDLKNIDLTFKGVDDLSIFNFGKKNNLTEKIEEYGKKLVNGDIAVDDYGNIYEPDYIDAK